MLEVCVSSLFCRFLPVCVEGGGGQIGRVACQGFLAKEACVSVMVGGAVSLLSGMQ